MGPVQHSSGVYQDSGVVASRCVCVCVGVCVCVCVWVWVCVLCMCCVNLFPWLSVCLMRSLIFILRRDSAQIVDNFTRI